MFTILALQKINPEGFEVQIYNKNATPVTERDQATSLPYITLFGLDSIDENGSRNYDEIIDKEVTNIVNMIDGELMFPWLHPFAVFRFYRWWKFIRFADQLGNWAIYKSTVSSITNGDHRWMIEAKYTNQSSTINLGFMLVEGSEEVVTKQWCYFERGV